MKRTACKLATEVQRVGSETPNCVAYSIPCAKANEERHAAPIAGRAPASWQRQHKRGETATHVGEVCAKYSARSEGLRKKILDPHVTPNILYTN